MSIAKVIEIIAEGDSVEDALANGVRDAGKSVRNIRSAYVEGIKALVKDGKISGYRVNAKITFVVN